MMLRGEGRGRREKIFIEGRKEMVKEGFTLSSPMDKNEPNETNSDDG